MALILMLSTAAPFQGTKQPDFLFIEEIANVMSVTLKKKKTLARLQNMFDRQ